MTFCSANACFWPKADISVLLLMSAWCPKGQFISGRVDVKIGGFGEHGG
jgi:hypothetical protein